MTPLDGYDRSEQEPRQEAPAARQLAPRPKHPPHSIEAEQSVLGGLLLNNRAWFDVADQLGEDDFYTHDHRMIWRGLADLLNAGKVADFITLSEYFRQRNKLDEVGGVAYLGSLAADTPSAANIRAYAKIVRERSILRGLIAVGQDIAELGYMPDGREPAQLLEEAEQVLFRQRNRGAREANQAEGYETLIARVEQRVEAVGRGDEKPGLQTGFAELDARTKGLHPGDLVIVGGRPGMGKSSLALNIGEHVAIDQGLPVLVFSMEMPREQIAMRSISARAGVPLERLKDGKLDSIHWSEVAAVGGRLRAAPLFVDDTGALSPIELRARARRYQAKRGLALVIVDYIQLMQVRGERNRDNEVGVISRALKALAKELGVPVIALSQLSRKCEERADKRPAMSDLRESGSIEQDADMVLLLYRDEYYHQESPDAGIAELDIAKQRNGPRGTLDLSYRGEFCRFENYTGAPRAPLAERRKQQQRDQQQAGAPVASKSGWRKNKPASAPPVPHPSEAPDWE